MKSIAILAAALPLADAFTRIAGYSPATNVADYLVVDKDQRMIHYYLEEVTPSNWAVVYDIYTKGGSSRPQGQLTMSSTSGIVAGSTLTFTTNDGTTSTASVSSVSGSTVTIDYADRTVQSCVLGGVDCVVGGYPSINQTITKCMPASGASFTIGTTSYSPSAVSNAVAGRTLQGFSTPGSNKMRSCSGSCPYWLFVEYADFYGVDDYGDKFVLGALGTPANGYAPGTVAWGNGKAMDFSNLASENVARYEMIVRRPRSNVSPPNARTAACARSRRPLRPLWRL